MPITAEDFLGTAQQLITEDGEPAWRSAASRAYYAAFHAALQHADQSGLDTLEHLSTGSHDRLILRFEQSGQRALAIMLTNMRATRVKADYHLGETLDQNQAKVQLATATKLLERLTSH